MDGTLGSLAGPDLLTNIAMYSALALAAVELAKRIATLTPGKTDDEIVSKVEKLLRVLIDFAAGQHTDRTDPGMIKTTPKEKPE